MNIEIVKTMDNTTSTAKLDVMMNNLPIITVHCYPFLKEGKSFVEIWGLCEYELMEQIEYVLNKIYK